MSRAGGGGGRGHTTDKVSPETHMLWAQFIVYPHAYFGRRAIDEEGFHKRLRLLMRIFCSKNVARVSATALEAMETRLNRPCQVGVGRGWGGRGGAGPGRRMAWRAGPGLSSSLC